MSQEQGKEDSKERWGQDTPLFDAAADIKRLGGAAVELYCPFHVCVEGFDHALQFWWGANLWKDLEKTVSADKIKRLCEVNESDIQEHLSFSALLLELAKGEDHVYC